MPLARAGLNVIGLEAGSWLGPRDFAADELRNNYRGWPQAVQKANNEIPTQRPSANAPNSPRLTIHPMMNAVGGTSVHYWAQSWRLNPWDFKVVSETTRRYGASRIPKGSTVEDWPFGLDELEPYYDTIEHEVGVSGKAGNIKGVIDPKGQTYSRDRGAREYPMPPLRGTEFTDMMAGTATKLGWHPFAGPAAINSVAYDDRAECMYHGFCSRGGLSGPGQEFDGLQHHPEGDGDRQTDRRRPGACDRNRRRRTYRPHFRRAPTSRAGRNISSRPWPVLMGAHIYENARLLLLSKSKAFPNGLSNNAGQVGKHYFSHNQTASVVALFPRNINNWYGLPAQGTGVDNFADDNFDHSGLDFIGGGNLWVYSDRRPIGAASMTTFGKAPLWGAAWKAFIAENADRWNVAYLQKTTLPYEDNYLDLDPTVKDPLGFPVLRITADYKDNERKISAYVQDKMTEWYMAAGAIATEKTPIGTMLPTTHAYGGTRMGRQGRNQCRQPLGLFARSRESRHHRWRRHGHERRPQPDADRTGARLADRRLSDKELEIGNRRIARNSRNQTPLPAARGEDG